MQCKTLLLVQSFMNKASGLFFCRMFPIQPVSKRMNMYLYMHFVLCINSSLYKCVFTPMMFDTPAEQMTQVIMLQFSYSVKQQGKMCQRKNKHRICFLSVYCRILYSCACLSFTLTVSHSLPVFSIVDRQMGASVTRRGVFDHTEAWVHYEGYVQWRQWWCRGGKVRGVGIVSSRAGACQICRLLLRLI